MHQESADTNHKHICMHRRYYICLKTISDVFEERKYVLQRPFLFYLKTVLFEGYSKTVFNVLYLNIMIGIRRLFRLQMVFKYCFDVFKD